ncbi:prepilin peptidase [Thermodesulfobacteriota bacterium]
MDTYLHIYWAVCSFLLGSVIGSFLNVVIARLPMGESLVSPSSRCPVCGHGIRFYDNVPMLSYFILWGRCRDCRTPISMRYPLVEFFTAVLFLLVYLRFGLTAATGVYFLFGAAMIAVTYIDLDHMIIPDVITLNLMPVGLSAAIVGLVPDVSWKSSLLGLFVGGALLYVPAVLYEKLRGIEGLGGGDIKLLAMMGAFIGLPGVFFVFMVSSLAGSLVGVISMAVQKAGSTTEIPFGPHLAFAAILYVLVGPQMIEAFLGMSPSLLTEILLSSSVR